MGRSRSWLTLAGMAGAFVLACMSCGGMEADPATAGDDTTSADGALFRHRRVPPPPSQPPPPPSSTGSGGSSGGATDPQAIIRAAQTADGQAIPQAAGPNGVCPAVVQLLGFWSCPTIGQTCSFSSGGATRQCTCSRTDGEGQNPTWICN